MGAEYVYIDASGQASLTIAALYAGFTLFAGSLITTKLAHIELAPPPERGAKGCRRVVYRRRDAP